MKDKDVKRDKDITEEDKEKSAFDRPSTKGEYRWSNDPHEDREDFFD